MIQLIQSHVWELSDLEGMDKRETDQTLGPMEARIVSATIKVLHKLLACAKDSSKRSGNGSP